MAFITAIMAPGILSYQRLVPHKWSSAFNNLAVKDREAGLRICPVVKINGNADSVASQFNLEYRAADASASPYLQLAALVRAGLQGIKDKLPFPRATKGDLSLLSEKELKDMGVEPLPESLEKALERFSGESVIEEWFPGKFTDIYKKHKNQELKDGNNLGIEKLYNFYCNRY